MGDETARREYDESHASDIFAAEATAPTGGGVHDRDSWNDVIAKLNQRAKRAKKDLAKKDRAKAKAKAASTRPAARATSASSCRRRKKNELEPNGRS